MGRQRGERHVSDAAEGRTVRGDAGDHHLGDAAGDHRAGRIRIDIRKRLADVELDVQLEVGAEILVLFGPSGAGKTTVLNAIAGLVQPDVGHVEIDGRVVFRRRPGEPRLSVPPRDRRVGYVFQGYALFPHLTALQNVAYPLRRRRDAAGRAAELLALLGIDHLAGQRPDQLSGGQQQRVALARALALESSVLLLDEPFAALDGVLRDRLMHDLKRLQRERGLAIIIVTHDLDDAFALGDRLAVLRDGRVEQVGPVAEVFLRPASNGVADVMGIRNVIRGRVVASTPVLTLDWLGTRLELDHADESRVVGDDVSAYIRPEDVKLIYPDRPARPGLDRNVLRATVVTTREAAGHRILQVRAENDATLEIRFPRLSYSPMLLVPGARVDIALRPSGVIILDG
jgi:molybdate transport system ATP-binding protein